MTMGENLTVAAGTQRCAVTPIRLRPVNEGDCQLLWEWCNDPAVRARSFNSDPITYAEHRRWLARKIANPDCIFFIASDERNVPLGQVRYDIEGEKAVVSVSVDDRVRGQGYGAEIIRRSAEKIFSETNVKNIHSYVKPDNEASIRAFEKSGYRAAGNVSMHDQPALHWILRRPR
jgi:UDP-2,4-diacetamido-2,4,6-trideoxy-beta-L-altropyranose hydrolase